MWINWKCPLLRILIHYSPQNRIFVYLVCNFLNVLQISSPFSSWYPAPMVFYLERPPQLEDQTYISLYFLLINLISKFCFSIWFMLLFYILYNSPWYFTSFWFTFLFFNKNCIYRRYFIFYLKNWRAFDHFRNSI